MKKNAKILPVRHKTLFKPCSNRTKRLEASLGGKNFLNSNGRPGCSQILAVLPETAIKNRKDYLTTITLYKFFKRKTIEIALPKNFESGRIKNNGINKEFFF